MLYSNVQVVLLLVACFLGVAFCLPFNAAALPGGWHYNGDVARTPNLAIAVRYNFLLSDFIFLLLRSMSGLAWSRRSSHLEDRKGSKQFGKQ